MTEVINRTCHTPRKLLVPAFLFWRDEIGPAFFWSGGVVVEDVLDLAISDQSPRFLEAAFDFLTR